MREFSDWNKETRLCCNTIYCILMQLHQQMPTVDHGYPCSTAPQAPLQPQLSDLGGVAASQPRVMFRFGYFQK